MGNEPNKQQGQQGQQGQSQSHQQGQQSHQQGQGQQGQGQQDTGSSTDKWKSNQPQPGGSTQDMTRKDPSRQSGSDEQEESDQGSKRRAS